MTSLQRWTNHGKFWQAVREQRLCQSLCNKAALVIDETRTAVCYVVTHTCASACHQKTHVCAQMYTCSRAPTIFQAILSDLLRRSSDDDSEYKSSNEKCSASVPQKTSAGGYHHQQLASRIVPAQGSLEPPVQAIAGYS